MQPHTQNPNTESPLASTHHTVPQPQSSLTTHQRAASIAWLVLRTLAYVTSRPVWLLLGLLLYVGVFGGLLVVAWGGLYQWVWRVCYYSHWVLRGWVEVSAGNPEPPGLDRPLLRDAGILTTASAVSSWDLTESLSSASLQPLVAIPTYAGLVPGAGEGAGSRRRHYWPPASIRRRSQGR